MITVIRERETNLVSKKKKLGFKNMAKQVKENGVKSVDMSLMTPPNVNLPVGPFNKKGNRRKDCTDKERKDKSKSRDRKPEKY